MSGPAPAVYIRRCTGRDGLG